MGRTDKGMLSDTRLPEAVDITTQQEAQALLARLRSIPVIALDTETTGLHRTESILRDEHDAPIHSASHVVYWSLSDGQNRWCLPRKFLPMFKSWLEDPARVIVMHNAPFDTWMLRNSGVELMNTRRWRRRDTMMMHALLDTSDVAQHDLKWIGRHVLDLDTKSFADTFGRSRTYTTEELLEQANAQVRAEYATLDAWMTYTAYQRFQHDLGHEGLWELYQDLEGPIGDVLLRMEYAGIQVDTDYLQALIPRIEREMLEVESRFSLEAGRALNLRSVSQLRDLFYATLGLPIYKYTKGGQSGDRKPALDDEVLSIWDKDGVTLARTLLRYRALDKTLNTYLRGLLECTRPDGRISTTFTQHVARTGRLTSKGPNLQNITKGGEFGLRQAFIAAPGMELLVFDFSQLELRIAAMLSGDKNLTEVFTSGRDLHSASAALLFGVPYEDVMAAKKAEHPTVEQKHLRYLRDDVAKRINFGTLYGAGAPRLSKEIGCEREEAQDYIDRFFKAYPGLRRWFDEIVEDCQQTGYVTMLSGRRRKISGIHAPNPQVRNKAIREACNCPVQGGAADIVKYVMRTLASDPVLTQAGARMLLQVHDEIVIELPVGLGKEIAPRIRAVAADPLNMVHDGDTMPVPLEVDIGIGQTWQTAKA